MRGRHSEGKDKGISDSREERMVCKEEGRFLPSPMHQIAFLFPLERLPHRLPEIRRGIFWRPSIIWV